MSRIGKKPIPLPKGVTYVVEGNTVRVKGPKGEVVTQMWTYEHTVPGGQPARAFVWMQGHAFTNFAIPQIQSTLLRGIAWAGKKPVDSLVATADYTYTFYKDMNQ